MNVAKLLEKRRVQWSELERLCDAMEIRGRTDKSGFKHHRGAQGIARFSTLYRAACADLALADAYQLPPGTITYLHRLVARSHNQLYRADKFEPQRWSTVIFETAPKQIFSDPCVRVSTIVFFGLFALAMFLGRNDAMFPGFADRMVGTEQLSQLEDAYEKPLVGSLDHYVSMSGFYIMHNTGIGLRCFAYGILLIPCLLSLAYNAVALGTMFGYMARPDTVGGDNFFEFVTAHGPFELTAIALAAAAGLRIGLGLFYTNGLARTDSIRVNAFKAVPVMAASALLFTLAAFTEGFISPSPLPYLVKAVWSVLSSGLISFYFVVLGFPRETGELGSASSAGDQPDAA
jgi:uncharacterized membrane protein SpoIIM required for sporulation